MPQSERNRRVAFRWEQIVTIYME